MILVISQLKMQVQTITIKDVYTYRNHFIFLSHKALRQELPSQIQEHPILTSLIARRPSFLCIFVSKRIRSK